MAFEIKNSSAMEKIHENLVCILGGAVVGYNLARLLGCGSDREDGKHDAETSSPRSTSSVGADAHDTRLHGHGCQRAVTDDGATAAPGRNTVPCHRRRSGKIVAYIGVREGSQRTPRKNIKPFWGTDCLIDVKIKALQMVPEVEEIIVSSDSEEMLKVARKYRGVTTILKSQADASSAVTAAEYFEYIGKTLACDVAHVLYAPVTAPLIEPKDFSKLIQTYLKADERAADAAGFVIERRGHFWYNGQPLN